MKTFGSKADILDRIKLYYNMKNDADLARFLDISHATLSNWKTRDSIDYDLVFSKCEHVDLNWLLAGKDSILKKGIPLSEPAPKQNSEIQFIHHPKVPDKLIQQQSIPVYNIEASANLKTVFTNKDQNVLGEITMPDIPRCDGAVHVRGDSMYPLLKSGDLVGYKEIHDFDNVIYGEMYLVAFDIEGDEFVSVKYVNHSDKEGCVKLVSYNSHHDPKDIPLTRINAMALVKFSIRMNTIL